MGMVGWFLFISDPRKLWRCNSRDICCTQSDKVAVSCWRPFFFFSSICRLRCCVPGVSGPRIMTSALENYINRILWWPPPALAGATARPTSTLERAGLGSAGGWDSSPLRGGDVEVKDLVPANPGPRAGTATLLLAQAPLNFNFEKGSHSELFPVSVEIRYSSLVLP